MSLLSPKCGVPPQTPSLIQRLAAVHTEADPQRKIMSVWLLHFHIHNSSPVTQQMQMYPKAQTNQITEMLLINQVQSESMKRAKLERPIL